MKTFGIDISVLNDKQRTGIGNYTYQLINGLLKINATDKFILFGFATFRTYNYLKNIDLGKYPNAELKIIKLPARSFRTAFLLWQKLNWLPVEKFIGQVDLFHSFNWYMPPQGSGKKVATVFDLTSVLYPRWHEEKTSQLDTVRFKRIARYADLVLAISKSAKDDFSKLKPKGRMEIIYPAADSLYNPKINREGTARVLQKFNLQPGFFLSVATLEPRKNLKNLVKGYLESKLDIPLVLVGKIGWKNEGLENLTNHKNIKMLGFVSNEELKILYQQALCVAYPSFYECFGIPVLEAMNCGTPVITSNTSSLPEVCGDAALYVDPESIKEISRTLIKISSDINLRQTLNRKGITQAKKFSWKHSAEKLNSLYQEITGQQ